MTRSSGSLSSVCRRLRQYGRSEAGVSTIEFIFWVPLVTVLLVFIANATLLLQTQTLMFDAARDMAREVATNNATTAQAVDRMKGRFAERFQVEASVTLQEGFVTATVTAKYHGITSLFGNMLGNSDLTAAVTMWKEQDNEV